MTSPCATIHHLPDELLVEIAHIFREQWSFEPRWLLLTFVCHRWRAVFLDYTPFWTKINATGDVERTRLYLERSKSSPIDLKISHYLYQDIQRRTITSLLSHHTHRIKGLSVGSQYAEDVIQHLGSPFPILERLDLLPSSYNPPMISLSPVAPRIKTLRVSQSTLDWRSPLFKDLSSLELSSAFRFRPCLHQFLDVLEACPSLESLCLEPDFEFESSAGGAPAIEESRSIKLPLLRRCHIDGNRCSIITLLQHIDIPCCRRVSFSTCMLSPDLPQSPEQSWVLRKDLHSRIPLIRDSTDLRLTSGPVSCNLWDANLWVSAPGTSFSVFAPLIPRYSKPAVFESTFALVQSFSITTVTIKFDFTCVTRQMWRDALTSLPSLLVLRIAVVIPSDAQSISAAEIYPVLGIKPYPHEIICPRLNDFGLFCVKLEPDTVLLLHTALRLRVLSNAKLQCLNIDGWYPLREVQWEWPDFSEVVDEFSQHKRNSDYF